MTNEPDTTAYADSPEFSSILKWLRLGYLLPWLLLISGLSLTYFVWHGSRLNTEHETQDYFNFRAREVVAQTQQRLQTYVQVLRGEQGLFKTSNAVGRNEFKHYVDALQLADNFPGVQGIGYAIVIPPKQKASHIAEMRREGFPEYTIKPEGKRDLYTSIIYLEPFSERNLRAFGYDMYSEPTRRAAMERARDTGQPAMSGKVLLVQEAQRDIQAGFLIYLPVYRNDLPHGTLAQRRANLVGWAYAPFRIADLVHGIYGERAPDLDIHIYDGDNVSKTTEMYDSSLRAGVGNIMYPQYAVTHRLTVAGHTWTMQVSSRPSLDSRIDTTRPGLFAIGGSLTTLLLTVLVWMLVNGRRRATQLAQHMNRELIASEQELRESEGKLQAVLDNAAVGIAWADDQGRIEYVNHRFTEMFGYTLKDIPTVKAWYQHAYPDEAYRSTVVTKWEADVAASRQQGTPIPSIELSIACMNGSICHAILTSALVGTDILVSFSDITELKRNEEKLQQWAQIFEHAEWGIVIGSADGKHIELANPEFAKVRGYTVAEVLQLSITDLFAPDERAKLPDHIRVSYEQGHHIFESVHLRKDGTTFPVLVNVTAVKNPAGEVLYRIVNVQDISERKSAEKALQDSRTILQSILDNSPYLIWLKDTAGRFIAINQEFLKSTGRKEMSEVLGKTDADLWPEHLAKRYLEDDTEVIASRRQMTLEEQALDRGRLVWMETSKTPVFDAYGNLLGVTGFARDITERKLDELKVRHQAHHDALTGLPNRVLLSDRLTQLLSHARRSKEHLAVLFMDLDLFKPVNDTYGHDIGDLLLKEVAQRLLACIRESDTAARIGGDEFCILLSSIESEQDVSLVAEKILDSMHEPFSLRELNISIASSIGIAIYPKDGRDEHTLLKNADIAMYWAKEAGRNTMKLFRHDQPPPKEQT